MKKEEADRIARLPPLEQPSAEAAERDRQKDYADDRAGFVNRYTAAIAARGSSANSQ